MDIGVLNRHGRGTVSGAELIITSDIALVASRHLGLPDEDLPFKALDGLPFVMPPQPNPLLTVLRDLAQKQRIEIDIALESASATLTRSAVTDGGLCTLVPLHLGQREYR